MLEKLIEGVDYFVCFWDFPNYASNMFCSPNEDGTFTICFNSRFTREQLLKDVPHEFRHILLNHFQDDRNVEELEAEADGVVPAAEEAPQIRHYLTLRGLLLGELEQANELIVFGSDSAKTAEALRLMMDSTAPLVVR